ncbi:uncharacterized protein LOC121834518 isoform X1 [Ixodes scapularis]|uniref:uncharacterized protein LOC115322298 isoform X1 n=1 Tax=Ixodes scapularis TaxID=6945 RepID=UPI001A9FDA3A|nr:uncharacterized protein LOC115322298 isoform X1 [Ixodes scapularis]XP_042144135.1 uncharacterized protein LOC121834510 isoform X1 [Ixodes scapularis]XP_042144147.1 uncharacterized protein LOC121834518 isoform X1 [Ixodes scapularis]
MANSCRDDFSNEDCQSPGAECEADADPATVAAASGLAPFTSAGVNSAATIMDVEEELCHLKRDIGVQVNTWTEGRRQLITISTVKDEQALLVLTGISSLELFYNIANLFTDARRKQSKRSFSLSNEDVILLVFTKLYHNVSFSLLAVLFDVHRTTASSIFKEAIVLLASVLGHAIYWPDKDHVTACLTKHFDKYRMTRMVLDCTEIAIERPKDLPSQILTYSIYKKTYTAKILICTTPGGLISYVSRAYGGRTSDTHITRESEVLTKCEPHIDKVMVDRGFLIEDLCYEHGLEMIRPPFLGQKKQLSPGDAKRNASIASARVHVERSIQRIKRFKILQQRFPLDLLAYLDSIVTTLAGIVNISKPLFADDKYLFP